MRVLLTGASGFIGSQVTRALLAAGCEVAALVMPGDTLWRLRDVAERLVLLEGTLYDIAALRPALADWRPEACIHLAWYAEPGKYLHSPENVPALTASLSLLEEMIRLECTQFVAAGTCAEYDTDAGWLREEGPTRPTTIYAASKLSFCLIGQQMAAASGINFAWGRIFYLYGPDEDPRRVVPAVIRALLRGESFPATLGEQVRDYLHVEDVASAFWALTERRASGVFNIASGAPVTMRQLMETVGDILGQTRLIQFGATPYRDWDPPFICGDNKRLRSTGWSPRHTLKQGLTATADWWRRSLAGPQEVR